MIKKYKISVPKSTLNSIYKKVRNYPWNNIQKMDGWLHGTNHDYLKKISKYWTSKFNWKLQEKKSINSIILRPILKELKFILSEKKEVGKTQLLY